mmetsp:Transcript_14582/g.25177  ORF Transcript_14582/g.25177 Transcript_14582/m.25177 type:complete len:209 (+) Transcript_14582:88-714(+)
MKYTIDEEWITFRHRFQLRLKVLHGAYLELSRHSCGCSIELHERTAFGFGFGIGIDIDIDIGARAPSGVHTSFHVILHDGVHGYPVHQTPSWVLAVGYRAVFATTHVLAGLGWTPLTVKALQYRTARQAQFETNPINLRVHRDRATASHDQLVTTDICSVLSFASFPEKDTRTIRFSNWVELVGTCAVSYTFMDISSSTLRYQSNIGS